MELTVPGDKSITQRGLILASLADGESVLSGASTGADAASTTLVLKALGASIRPVDDDPGTLRIRGQGLRGLQPPGSGLDFGNSGTGARLMMGVLAAQPLSVTMTGDASLQSRPMRRIMDPLLAMGAQIAEMGQPDRLPIEVRGGPLHPCLHDSPVASAQVKSALLLAGLCGGVAVEVSEPVQSRDHSERLLGRLGAGLRCAAEDGRWRVNMADPPDHIPGSEMAIPGDFSSAAYFIALAILGGAGGTLVLKGVGLNPTRTGLLGALARMGASVRTEVSSAAHAPEPIGVIQAGPCSLHGVQITATEVPSLIDELPIIAVLASRAQGETRISGAAELRVKESDRISALVGNLRAVGVEAEELGDGLVVQGGDHPLHGSVESRSDHRIAMAFGVLGAIPGNRIAIGDRASADVSFPGFWELLSSVTHDSGVGSSRDQDAAASRTSSREGPLIVTLDGPAGSGKSTTAREVAERLGYRHLDSGALYRAIAFALLDAGIPENEWEGLPLNHIDGLGIEAEPVGDQVRITLSGRVLTGELRSPEATRCSPIVAQLPAVREWLLSIQRALGESGGLVADGRDMGSVVFPNADVKVYLEAELEERARRRLLQEGNADPAPTQIQAEAERIQARDEQDAGREQSPLVVPAGAHILNTTHLDFDQQVSTVVDLVRGLTPS